MALTTEQIHEAIGQMLSHCELAIQDYEPLSARGTLRTLGYDGEDLEQVLTHIYEGGFTYCLDPEFAATHFDPNNPRAVGGMVTDRPPMDACYWGPDQLESRLRSLSNVPYTVRLQGRG